MDQTKPISTKLFSLLQPAMDCTTFIGSGIFASTYSTLWMNDPTSKSGIVLAGFLNAATLGIVNHSATNEKTSSFYKIAITVVTLSISALTTPYLAILLKDRFAIVLTPQVALQIGGLNLVVKAATYVLTSLGSYATRATTAEEIEQLSDTHLQKKYQFFQTLEGKVDWNNQTEEVRLKYLKAFFTKGYSFVAFDDQTYKKMHFSTTLAVIKSYTKEQAVWLHNILSSQQLLLNLSPKVTEAYVTLFYNNELGPLLNLNKFTLPVQTLESIRNLNATQAAWYKHFSFVVSWVSFSLELQEALNAKFIEHGIAPNKLLPPSLEEIKKAPKNVVEKLYPESNLAWLGSSIDMQEALNESFIANAMASLPTHPQTIEKVNLLTDDEISSYHAAYTQGLCSHQFSDELQRAFSVRFMALKLLQPTPTWKFDYQIPTLDELNNISALQAGWHSRHFYSNPAIWSQLDFPLQVAYNKIFNDLYKSILFYYPYTPKDVETLNNKIVSDQLHSQYSNNKELWNNLTLEMQQALNTHFGKFGLALLEVTKNNPQAWGACSKLFQQNISSHFYNYFQTDAGKIEWDAKSEEDQLAYLNAFIQNNLPFIPFNNANLHKLDVFTTPAEINAYTSHQSLWIHHILSSKDPINLSREASQAYVDLFYKEGLPALPKKDQKNRILPGNIKLPIPTKDDEINSLTPAQTSWYKLLTEYMNHWKLFSLELQETLNQKFEKEKFTTWYLEPSSPEGVQNTSLPIIQKLIKKYEAKPEHWKNCSNEVKQALALRFYEFFQTDNGKKEWATPDSSKKLATWLYPLLSEIKDLALSDDAFTFYLNLFYSNDLKPLLSITNESYGNLFQNVPLPTVNSSDEMNKLTDNQVYWHRLFYTVVDKEFATLSLDLQYAWNLQFIKAKLETWPLQPSTSEDIEKASKPAICDIALQYTQKPAEWSSLRLAFKVDLNQRFVEFGIEPLLLVPPSEVEVITELSEPIIKKFAEQYDKKPLTWLDNSIDEQDAFNAKFKEFKLTERKTHPQNQYDVNNLSDDEIRNYHQSSILNGFDEDWTKAAFCKRFAALGLKLPAGWKAEQQAPQSNTGGILGWLFSNK